MQSKFPCIPISLYHLRFTGHVFIIIMTYITFTNKWLEVTAEFDAVGRVKIDHLHLSSKPFVVQKRVHYNKRISKDHAIYPLVPVFVSLEYLISNRPLWIAKEIE